MKYLVGGQIFDDYIREAVYKDTQVEGESVALTAEVIYRLISPGELDFGGSEFKAAAREQIEPERRDPSDDYGWWELPEGGYIIQLNEIPEISEEATGILQPHEHLLAGGSFHPTLWLDNKHSQEKILLPLHVNKPGLNIKENARVSKLKIIES
ncbi:MAG: dCTP deaminase [bacterium]